MNDSGQPEGTYHQRLQSAYLEVQAILSATSGEERLRLLGQAGNLARQLGLHHEAGGYFQRAVESAQEQGRPRFEVANRIRLGINFFELKDYAAAEEQYRETLEQISTTPETESYRDFVLYQIGRLLIEQGLLDEAREVFEAVLILRQQKGDSELIASAREALLAIEEMRQEDEFGTY